MLQEDKNMLESLVDKYSLEIVVRTLASLASSRADEMADLLLKEKAIVWSDTAEVLNEAAVAIKE